MAPLTNKSWYYRLFNANTILLFLILLVIFIMPVFSIAYLPILYPFCFTGMFLASAISIEKNKKLHMFVAVGLTMVLFFTIFMDHAWIRMVSRSLQFAYFIWIVISLVKQIAGTKKVNEQVIVSSITAYFLLGYAFILMATTIAVLVPGAYNLDTMYMNDPNRYKTLQDITYYTFVTYTTTGYGDLLPLKPVSRSLAILMSSCGQLYIAIIIAMLVGKYSGLQRNSE
jgi:voltage-gated potassium channel